ncbi:hypothetical protein A2641_03430 [Candidatus Nomurabacteria bacterium RIFCSPHIGHO2_01_FULL_37_25]|uniref:Uncharacterized protein n=1 Tax=Candidatus Nomurabacteria bacterium RIFCSPLOWO2_01_FULL_36_16 TaxID=1801767 RepID=A0A1F6WZP4_9BACT|nr:MAG: hypothetical protein A2641_03430 [Candidatus Nomurabacteria bacterium RIFCSPHIGHO2_01_FULL_37_25]OGI75541.1 MAG: hypothetical protein A3D36_03075 [Candidatus Nomurabacteria bacterium RIFCSPHIGHO2_02_FULL_36_29]OGI87379.1 MAG: hypothetical protein A3A91_02695 [Candidatus Nomurabacteria bacterium RIFCSPLOWO2_01_FULL_36_16]OGI96858.1 MAG: hypothetical protein A3I84_03010 [Candidatus Nomurabacteria bacterium RIFCSPLOWO2_02_FULL_36_8]
MTIEDLIFEAYNILSSIIPVLVALGVVYFVWGVVQYVIGGGDEAKKKGRDRIIYGIIGLTVIVSVWGLVSIIAETFGLTNATGPVFEPIDTCQTLGPYPRFQDLVCYITTIINNAIIPLIFALAMVMFVWGVVQYVIKSDEEAKKQKGKQFMLWGLIALTVMVSVWGLVEILGTTFGINTSFIPQVKTPPP